MFTSKIWYVSISRPHDHRVLKWLSLFPQSTRIQLIKVAGRGFQERVWMVRENGCACRRTKSRCSISSLAPRTGDQVSLIEAASLLICPWMHAEGANWETPRVRGTYNQGAGVNKIIHPSTEQAFLTAEAVLGLAEVPQWFQNRALRGQHNNADGRNC